MPVDSLVELSRRACGRISKRITDIGGMPYDLARPILLKIESPEQLHIIETNCPQIIGHSAELWLNLIKRDIPDWQSKRHEPRDPHNWWKVYRKLKAESVASMDAGADKLKAALDNIKNEREQNLAQIKTRKELPRSGRASSYTRFRHSPDHTASRGSTKPSLLEKIRREGRDARSARMSMPMHELKKQASGVTKAPAQFVEDLRTQQQEQQRRSLASPERAIRVPKSPSGVAAGHRYTVMPTKRHSADFFTGAGKARPSGVADSSELTYRQMQDREARLRALTSGKGPAQELRVASRVPDVQVDLATLDGSSSPPPVSVPKSDVAQDTTPKPTSPPTAPRPGLSASFLEEPSPRRPLGDSLERPRSSGGLRSPARVASPQPTMVRKRKEPPNLFMSTPKRQVVLPENVPVNRSAVK